MSRVTCTTASAVSCSLTAALYSCASLLMSARTLHSKLQHLDIL
jgi:hypothetical protein